MSKPRTKPLIGIVGGIGAGKSTVAAEFAKLGCAVVDADAIAHQALQSDPVRDEIVRRFGPSVLGRSGRIDRKELAAVAFAESEKLAALNKIIHPLVFQKTEELIAQHERDDSVKAVVLDMPLLMEVGWADRCDRVVFVDCTSEQRLDRARRTRSLTAQEVKIRENFQISLDTKQTLADNTIDNNSGFSALVTQIKTIFSDMTKV
ncbi:MAG: dephospho-CoA kinase [Planctomycetota bacterium]